MHTCRNLGPRDEERRCRRLGPKGRPYGGSARGSQGSALKTTQVFKGENHHSEASDQWTKPRRRLSKRRREAGKTTWVGLSNPRDRTMNSACPTHTEKLGGVALVWTGLSDCYQNVWVGQINRSMSLARVRSMDRTVRPYGSNKYSSDIQLEVAKWIYMDRTFRLKYITDRTFTRTDDVSHNG